MLEKIEKDSSYYNLGVYQFNGKEKDDETGYNYYGARYYDSKKLGWLSVDPMSDKYPNLSPYVYCANNPVKIVDPNGKEGVAVVNKKQKTITIRAEYFVKTNNSNLSKNAQESSIFYNLKDVQKIQKQVNNELNNANYKVFEGEYANYNVQFDLKFIASDGNNYQEEARNVEYDGISIGNTFEKSTEINPFLNEKVGGTTLDCKHIIMNSKHDFKRNRIHEIFHTLFFNNDNAENGIGNYYPGDDMPNQNDINQLINNKDLKKVEE